jgi:hypothetical protein
MDTDCGLKSQVIYHQDVILPERKFCGQQGKIQASIVQWHFMRFMRIKKRVSPAGGSGSAQTTI